MGDIVVLLLGVGTAVFGIVGGSVELTTLDGVAVPWTTVGDCVEFTLGIDEGRAIVIVGDWVE